MNCYDAKIVERILAELEKREIKQTELVDLCNKVGMPISQPDLSKIMSGKKKTVSAYQLVAISNALNIPVDFLVRGENTIREDFCNPHNSPKLHDSGKDLEYYKGHFHVYFLSTVSFEDKLLHGELDVHEEKDYCAVNMVLDTVETYDNGRPAVKEYTGRILTSSAEALGAAYLLLKSEEIGEFCMICFKHRNYNNVKMECRMGLSLTIGAGDEKSPTVHRCLVTRSHLSGQALEEIRPWLGLIQNDINIEKGEFDRLIEEEIAMNPGLETEFQKVCNCAFREERVILSVRELKNRLKMPREELNHFISVLYRAADASSNYKISQSDDTQFYEQLKSVHKKETNNV